MSDDTIAPDPVVETALRLLPVPDHGPTFWTALGERLAAEPPVDEPALAVGPRRVLVAGPVEPAPPIADVPIEPSLAAPLGSDPSTRLVPPVLRRGSNVVLALVALAAAVMVVVAGSTLVRQRTEAGLVTPAAATDDTTGDGEPAVDDEADAPSAATAASTASVLAWVTAMGAADTKQAWGMLGPASRSHFGSQAAFAQQSALAQGDYTFWATSKPEDALVLAVPTDTGAIHVVTLVGAAKEDAATRRWAVAVPVRVVDGAIQVEPFAFAGEVDLVVPRAAAPGSPLPIVALDDELVVVVPRGVDAPTIRLDDGPVLICGKAADTQLAQLDSAPGQRCSYRPAKGMTPGRRVFTIAFVSPDGSGIAAESVMFQAV